MEKIRLFLLFNLLTISSCSPVITGLQNYTVKTVDSETGKPVPYAVLILQAYKQEGVSTWGKRAKVSLDGKGKIIITDANGEANFKPISTVGLSGYSVIGAKKYWQVIGVNSFSLTHALDYKGTHEIPNNSINLDEKYGHNKIILMKNMEKSNRSLANHIRAYVYNPINREELVIPAEHVMNFCHFAAKSKNYNLEDLFRLEPESNEAFQAYIYACDKANNSSKKDSVNTVSS